jgi:hypothetical protein
MTAMSLNALPAGPSPLALQPQPVSEIFDRAFRTYRANFWLFATLGLASGLPDLVRALLSGGAHSQDLIFSALTGGGDGAIGSAPANPLFVLAGYALWLLCLPIATSMVVQATVDISADGRPTFVSVLRRVLRRYWVMALVLLLFGVALLPTFLCVLFPVTLWLWVRWSVALPALFAEGTGPMSAIERSSFLTAGRWWRTFGILLLAYMLTFVVALALQGVLELAVGLLPGLSGDVRGAVMLVAGAVGEGFVRPLWPIIITLVYFDLRVRREALELDVLARQAMQASRLPA